MQVRYIFLIYYITFNYIPSCITNEIAVSCLVTRISNAKSSHFQSNSGLVNKRKSDTEYLKKKETYYHSPHFLQFPRHWTFVIPKAKNHSGCSIFFFPYRLLKKYWWVLSSSCDYYLYSSSLTCARKAMAFYHAKPQL